MIFLSAIMTLDFVIWICQKFNFKGQLSKTFSVSQSMILTVVSGVS